MIRSIRNQQNTAGVPEEERNDSQPNEVKRKLLKKKDSRQTPRDSPASKPASLDQERIDNSKHNISELKKLLDKSKITVKPLQTTPTCDKTMRNPQVRNRDKKVLRKPVARQTETPSVIRNIDPETRPPLLTPPAIKRTAGLKKELVIVSIFKNEAVAIREWIVHHMWQGVEHFYMIDNGSTDDWQKQVEGLPVTIIRDDERHQQTKHYNQYFLDVVKLRANWVLVLDLDEFVYAKGGKSIPTILSKYPPSVTRIKLRWKMFGSSGHNSQPSSIVHGFTFRKRMGTANTRNIHADCNVKSIVRTEVLNRLDIHCSKISDGKSMFEPSTASEGSLTRADIHCNHYAIQSWDWFRSVKMTRGSANIPANDKVRTKSYFKTYDWNDVPDRELSKIIENIQDSIRLQSKAGLG
tara:strand:+ start:318 stop:1544 length:1227 start_codon:yes stop_codon:yes gene_type:complete